MLLATNTKETLLDMSDDDDAELSGGTDKQLAPRREGLWEMNAPTPASRAAAEVMKWC